MRSSHALLTVCLFSVLPLGACDLERSSTDREKRSRQSPISDTFQKQVKDLARKHNAITDWAAKLGEAPGLVAGSLYTIELEEALVDKTGLPILALAHLHDVERSSRGVKLTFEHSIFFQPRITFILQCRASDLEDLRLQKPGLTRIALAQHYAVIAEIRSVQKVALEITPSLTSADSSEVRISPSEDRFIARGNCVAIAREPDPK